MVVMFFLLCFVSETDRVADKNLFSLYGDCIDFVIFVMQTIPVTFSFIIYLTKLNSSNIPSIIFSDIDRFISVALPST